jgi:hypothetical protein
MKDLSEILFAPKLKLATFDISNMYTNIPTEELINIIEGLCEKHNIEKHIKNGNYKNRQIDSIT